MSCDDNNLKGKTFMECPVETEIGMRIPDVVWASAAFIRSRVSASTLAFETPRLPAI
jgi:hypothetical protein